MGRERVSSCFVIGGCAFYFLTFGLSVLGVMMEFGKNFNLRGILKFCGS